jgi:Double zinc ribbon
MQLRNETQNVLAREIRIVPGWAWTLAVIVFFGVQIIFHVMIARGGSPPPPWARAVLGLLAGIAGSIYLLFIGYINRDAKRRGMSGLLWTLVAILIPNALGILLYFVLRQPLGSACPQCGNAVQSGFSFCPRCGCKMGPSCPRCQRPLAVEDAYCAYCGTSLHNLTPPVSNGSRA